MTSSDSKVEKVQKHFAALSSVASSLNEASNELTKVVSILDEALKKLNVGLTVWVTFQNAGGDDPNEYDQEQIGYCKVSGKWGIALRNIWGRTDWGEYQQAGPWLFNDAPRDMRLQGVDKIPEVIEALGKQAFETTRKVQEKTQQIRELARVIEQISKEHEAQTNENALAAQLNTIAKAQK